MTTPNAGPPGPARGPGTADPGAPRIAPGTPRQVGPVGWLVAAVAGKVTGTEPPKLFLTLGRHQRLFLGWLHFAGAMMPSGRLPRADTELVILRVASRTGCRYELEHHRPLARAAGLDELTIGQTIDATSAPTDHRRRLLVQATDQLLATDDIDDDTWAELSRHLDERQLIELVVLVGHYRMLATTITTLRITPDRQIVAAQQPRLGLALSAAGRRR